MKIDLAVLELTCSRLCHDLISPIGAVNNGLELLEDEEDPALVAEARALAARSARRASILLQAYRCAIGNAGNQASFGFGEAIKLARDFLEGGKVSLSGVPAMSPSDLPGGWSKLLLIMVILMSETLPRGGDLHLSVQGEGPAARFMLVSEGAQIVFPEDHKVLLAGENGQATLDARNVLAYLTGTLAARLKLKIEATQPSPTRLEIRIA
ncbi:histidine phosphotransferase family protein [Dongia sp.]|uniref:histidine phosphotransferase family protein n=1 Tax=Dongia sp. TaxID=1977262 RepID=UPI0035AFFF81